MYKLFNLCKNQKVSRKVKLDEKIINDWECCICYSKLNEGPIKICIPYKCDHITCYQCLCDYTSTIVENENNVNVSSAIALSIIRAIICVACFACPSSLSAPATLNNRRLTLFNP